MVTVAGERAPICTRTIRHGYGLISASRGPCGADATSAKCPRAKLEMERTHPACSTVSVDEEYCVRGTPYHNYLPNNAARLFLARGNRVEVLYH